MKRTILDFFTKASRERQETSDKPACTPDSDVEDPPTVTADASPASPGPAEQVEEPVPSTSTASEPPKKKTKTYSFQSAWLTHKDFQDWLRITTQDGKTIMHCAYCRECGPGTAGNSTFVTGHTLYKRESLKKHGDSHAHKKCRDKCCGPQQGRSTIQAAFDRQDAAQCTEVQAELKLKFNTAYMIGKEELPFTKFKPMIQLMQKNGLNINTTYSNDTACAKFIKAISDTLRESTATRISTSTYLSFMIDGDTDVEVRECEIVYARILEDGKPKNILVGHVEVKHAHAQGLYDATKTAFASLGEPCQNWLEKTVGMTADGANVNFGRKGGVIVHVKEAAGDHVVPFHCMPHRLELALLSAQRNNPMVGTVYEILDMVYRTYHDSAKSRRDLKKLGGDLGVTVLNPGAVKGTRWLPHVSRALHTLLKPGSKDGGDEEMGQFTAVHFHMDHLAESSKNADIKGRARKVMRTMEDGTFVAFCHFLADMFTEVSNLCLFLQKNDVILPKAVAKLEHLLLVAEGLVERPLPDGRLASFQKALQDQRQSWEHEHPDGQLPVKYYYRDVELKKGEADKISMAEPISTAAPTLQRHIRTTVAATVDHIKSRFSSLLGMDYEGDPARKAVHYFCFAFNPDQWPDRMEDLLDYGELYIEFLLDYFHTVLGRNGCDIQHSKEEYRAMKIDVRRCFNRDKSYNDLYEALLTKEPYCTEYKNILHLVSIMLVLPISSAQCERGFSAQRRIKGSTRASMGVGTVEDLIRISADGPSLEDFDGRRARRPEFSRPCPVC